MDQVKNALALFIGGRLLIEGQGRTFVKVPIWLTALGVVWSFKLAVVTFLLIIAFGMKASIVKA